MSAFSNPPRASWPSLPAGETPVDPPAPAPTSYATPKTAAIKYSNGSSASTLRANVATFGRFKLLIMGWDETGGSVSAYQGALNELRAAAAAASNADFKVIGYVCCTEVGAYSASPAASDRWNGYHSAPAPLFDGGIKPRTKAEQVRGDGFDWINRSSGGTPVAVNGNTGVNYTPWVAADGSGWKYPQWYARYMHWCATVRMGLSWDGLMTDNTHYYGGSADWNHNTGDADVSVNPTTGSGISASYKTKVREGHRSHIDTIRALYGSPFIVVGNGQPNTNASAVDFHQSAEIDQQLNGVLYEAVYGEGYSDWGQYGWSVVKANLESYLASCAAVGGRKFVVSMWKGSATDYKLMRLGLCSTLMTDAHFLYTSSYSAVPLYYDEFDAALGAPLEAGALKTANVWGRKFENGYVLVNVGSTQTSDPGGSTTYTGLPAGIYKRLAGTQDAAANSGAVVGAGGINIPAWDGRILLCVTPGVHA